MTTNLSENEMPLSVLVADGDEDSRRRTQAALAEAGIGSDGAGSGAEAMDLVHLRHARRQDYDLILVDRALTAPGGAAIVREIRDLLGENATVATVVIAVSPQDDADAAGSDADAFLAKPFSSADVLREYRRARRHRLSGDSMPHPAELEGKHILVAEDMTVSAEIVRQMLAMNFLTVDRAEDGRKAVDRFEESPAGYYDAILMDIRMPVMDGLDATKAIRALARPDAKTVPIIALTTSQHDEDVQRSLAAGMDAHLEKPVEPEQLYRTLAELIGKR